MIRRLLRFGWRSGVVAVGLLAIYLLVTFAQVWNASHDDHHGAADAVVVLGAAQYDGTPSPVLQRRLNHAIELYEAGTTETIVVTGGKQEGDRFTEAAASYRYLRQSGIPDSAILREEQGANTFEQLAATRRILDDRELSSVIFVSDDYHAYRLARIAEEVGFDDVQVSPIDSGLSFGGQTRAIVRETGAVALGRIVGFRRLGGLG